MTFNEYCDEITFNFFAEYLQVKEMSKDRVTMLKLLMPKTVFETWQSENEETHLCFDLENVLKNPLKNIHKDDSLIFRYNGFGNFNLDLKSGLTRQFQIIPLKYEEQELPEPKIVFTTRTTLIVKDVLRILKDIPDYENVRLSADQDKLVFACDSDSINYKVDITKGDIAMLNHEVKEIAKASYSIDQLKPLIKSIDKLSETMILEFAEDMPLKITVPLMGDGELTFWCAPRISE